MNVIPFIEKVASILAEAERKKGKFQGINREKIARQNLAVVLGRPPDDSEIKLNFFYHVLYHIQLVLLPTFVRRERACGIIPPSNMADVLEDIKNEGIISVLAHIGLPEAVALEFTRSSEVEVHALVERLESPIQRYFFRITRRNFGVFLHTSLKSILREMKTPKGKVFVFLVDRPLPGSKENVLFQRFNMQDLPLRISERFGINIWVASALRKGAPKYASGYKSTEQKREIPNITQENANWRIEIKMQKLRGMSKGEMFRNLSEAIEHQIAYSPLEWNAFFV